MPSILNLKFKGNKSFVAFSNLNDGDALTKTWKVCTKVASFLEQGQRLENLSWRLWHLQNLMVDTDNAKSKREFKKLSKCMGDKLDKEKGRSIEELEAPDFKRNPSVEMIRQRAAEKERMREANQHLPGTINRMQFTFSVDQPTPAPMTTVVRKSESSALHKSRRAMDASEAESSKAVAEPASLKLPSIFSNDFGPSALLDPTPTRTTAMNYGETPSANADHDAFSVPRPTIELQLDEILHHVDASENDAWISSLIASHSAARQSYDASVDQDVTMAAPAPSASTSSPNKRPASAMIDEAPDARAQASSQPGPAPIAPRTTKKHTRSSSKSVSSITVPPLSQAVKDVLPEAISPTKANDLHASSSSAPRSSGRPTLTVRTQAATPTTRSSGPGATATSLNPAVLRGSSGNSAPGGVKAECSNCGATHTPLWRRGLNDELNCNACGLYCKLHKRPRPKSMRNNHGEGRTQAAPRQETVDVMAQCYNCHTTATPLWRKDDEGKTVCNACGLYYKLHGTARPISMKSDVIRKRSRHDARRANSIEDTPSASPGVSRRTSPVPESNQPTLAPDNSTAAYDYTEEVDMRSHQSELIHALGGHDGSGTNIFTNAYNYPFPGPYHPDHMQMYNTSPLAFAEMGEPHPDNELVMSPRSNKRRRLSTDSASEPPNSAVSFVFSNDEYSSTSSATSHSQRSSIDFPFSGMGSNGPALRGSGNTFWHPPMLPQGEESAAQQMYHQQMNQASAAASNNNAGNNGNNGNGANGNGNCVNMNEVPQQHSPAHSSASATDDSPMDYLHPPMLPQDEELFSTYLHPPMALPNDDSHGQLHTALNYDYSQAAYEAHEQGMRAY